MAALIATQQNDIKRILAYSTLSQLGYMVMAVGLASGEAASVSLTPHTDSGFMTLLAPNPVPGLSILLPDGRWVDAPAVADAFVVNGGDILHRWTNERFLATPHRVLNRSGRDRYAIPFFFDCHVDWPIECLPTCVSASSPAKFEPFTYASYMAWYQDQNYARDSADGVRIEAY